MSIVLSTAKYLVVDLLGDAVQFPFWWYTTGAKKAAIFCWRKIKDIEEGLAWQVWVTNIFRPMFGQYDLAGKLISFFVRVVQIIFRSAAMILVILFFMVLFLIWLTLPIFLIYQIVITFTST